jgi:hypothetical protein
MAEASASLLKVSIRCRKAATEPLRININQSEVSMSIDYCVSPVRGFRLAPSLQAWTEGRSRTVSLLWGRWELLVSIGAR